MMPFYRLLTYAGSTLVVPGLFLRSLGDPAGREALRQRLGGGAFGAAAGRRIWLQAVSVGEVRVAETFAAAARRTVAGIEIALSATTSAGLERARALGDLAPEVFAFPLDLPFAVKRTLAALRPAAYGSVETEIWPGLLSECGRRKIPVFIVNGSISERSARRYRLLGGAVASGLGSLRAACMQSQEDASRILSLGAPPESIVVTGNIKFDAPAAPLQERAERLRRDLALPADAVVMIAGSTAPGEEAIVLEAWRLARESLPDLRLIVAPRHRERFDEAASILAAAGATVARRSRSSGKAGGSPAPVTLLDTLGELEAAYTLAQVAFVGGSLVPRGGQNPLEPARAGVPVLFGSGMDSFREVAGRLVACGGAFEVSDAASLADRTVSLLKDPAGRTRAAEAARGFVASHAGATRRTLSALARRIPEVFAPAALAEPAG